MITSLTATGIKGQWSYGIASFSSSQYPVLYLCVARNTWVEVYDKEAITDLTQGFVTQAELQDAWVPPSQLTFPDWENSPGKKGQETYLNGYAYKWFATNSVYRQPVEVAS